MTATDTSVRLVEYNPQSMHECVGLAAMYSKYLEEELDRTGHMAPGFPVASFLRTVIIWTGNKPAGFVSIDIDRASVELIWVAEHCRGQGIATEALSKLASSCPRPMELKAPLSPGGEVLAERLGLNLAHSTPEHIQEAKAAISSVEQMMRRMCKHKRKSGDPRRTCRKCYVTCLRRHASNIVGAHAHMARKS